MIRGRIPHCGFTLLEVLVALVVAAIALGALWKGLSQGIVVSQGLPDRVIARWAAQNRLIERQALGEWPDTRSYSGSVEMGGREWYWEEQISATAEPSIRRVSVRVGKDPESTGLFSMEGFLQQPGPGVPPPAAQAEAGDNDSVTNQVDAPARTEEQ